MLLYGSLLRCLDPVLTIAAAQGWGRPVFWSTPDKREEVGHGGAGLGPLGFAPPLAAPLAVCLCTAICHDACQALRLGATTLRPATPATLPAQAEAARRSVAAAVAASKSDHLAVVAAYNSWRAVLEKVSCGSFFGMKFQPWLGLGNALGVLLASCSYAVGMFATAAAPPAAPCPLHAACAAPSLRHCLMQDGRQAAHEFCGRSFLSDQALEASWVAFLSSACWHCAD